jgi:hypothetical protein
MTGFVRSRPTREDAAVAQRVWQPGHQ